MVPLGDVMEQQPRLVETTSGLADLTAVLRDANRVALDTESNAFHAYHARLCLLQIAALGRVWVVDTLAVPHLGDLVEIFDHPRIEKILHAAEGDILMLRRQYGVGLTNVFDTMLAARLLGVQRFGLADLLSTMFDVTLDKRFQRHNWGVRPVPAPALRYAAADVTHLEELRDRLAADLQARERWQEAQELFEAVSRVVPEERNFDPDSFWRVKGARDLAGSARAILRELYMFRDGRARSQDRPPVKVLSDEALIAVATNAPLDLQSLRRCGLSPLQVDRYGQGLLSAVRRGIRAPVPQLPRPTGPRPDPRIILRFDALRAWRKSCAAERGVDPEVVISNAALRALANDPPRTEAGVAEVASLGPWRAQAYASGILATLRAPELQ